MVLEKCDEAPELAKDSSFEAELRGMRISCTERSGNQADEGRRLHWNYEWRVASF